MRAVAAIQHLPSPTPPDSPFLRALGTTAALKAPPQTDTLAQRALEEWERTLCENKAVAILAEVQAGRPTIIHKDGGEMLIAIVLDRPLAEAKALVDDPAAFTREMTRILRGKTKPRGSRGAPFGEGTLSPLRRYLKPLPKGGRGGGGGERGTEAPLRYLKGASKASKVS